MSGILGKIFTKKGTIILSVVLLVLAGGLFAYTMSAITIKASAVSRDITGAAGNDAAINPARFEEYLKSLPEALLPDEADQAMKLINEAREAEGLQPLEIDLSDDVYKSAVIRLFEITVNKQQYYGGDHTRPDGSPWYTVSAVIYGENIGADNSAEKMVKAWLKSDKLKANLLNEDYNMMALTAMKIGKHTFWALEFSPNRIYTVTFDPGIGTVTETSRTVFGPIAIGTLPKAESPGYRFDGWYTDAEAGTEVTTATIVNANATYYAHWSEIKRFVVTFDANGGSVAESSRTVDEGDFLGFLPTPTRNGYTFDGWWTHATAGVRVTSETTVTEAVVYYARWIPVKRYTISFNPNGGSVSEVSRPVEQGKAVGTLPTATRAGYVFDGWYTAATGGSKVSPATTVTADATYYAHWIEAKKYVVSFNANGGTVSEPSRSVEENKAIGTLPTPTRTDYAFDGWFTAATGGTAISAATTVTAAVTYYAHWTPVVKYTVSFNANGGTGTEATRQVANNSAIGTLPTPTYSGYTFNGWFTAASGGTQISAATTVTGDVTYYAQWTAIIYQTVTFNPNGGAGTEATRQVANNSAVGALPTATLGGSTFVGWFTDPAGGIQVLDSTVITASVTFYAHWTTP
ncbi:MAG: InlB B-repeat-containing protein [Clostridiales Family XIII bacterium]|nr:InlB B-repeat-containing protein [Clostridiales Family XIII bacterium]